jgi:hypothetical protein
MVEEDQSVSTLTGHELFENQQQAMPPRFNQGDGNTFFTTVDLSGCHKQAPWTPSIREFLNHFSPCRWKPYCFTHKPLG